MELTFSTRHYKSRVTKSAVIYTSDLSNSQVRITVSATVDPSPDTTLSFSCVPNALRFTQEEKKFDVVLSNKSDRTMYVKSVGDTYEDLAVKMDDMRIKAGEDKKIEFSWTGEFEKENIERSITFDVSASNTERITIPFVVEGTDPTPEKPAVTRKPGARKARTEPEKK